MKKPRFEIGCMYKKPGVSRIYLAITHEELLYAEKGIVKKCMPYTQYTYRNDLTFDDMCENWGMSESSLDQVTKKYLPSPRAKRTRPKGNRRKVAEEFFWRDLRSASISLSA